MSNTISKSCKISSNREIGVCGFNVTAAFIPEVAATGAYMMNVHYEACTHLHRTVAAIKEAGMKAAVTLNPHTPISLLEDILQDLDMVLLMSVNPGYGGQKFINIR